jgi:hypothetical protein
MGKIVKIQKDNSNRISQGDVIKNVEYIEYAIEKEGIIEISKIKFPAVIVLTQDCDLNQDKLFRNDLRKTQDKQLISVLVAPIYNLQHFYEGKHLSELGLKMETFQSNPKKTQNREFKENKNPRYHYLNFPEGISLPESVIDFKHYFSVNINILEQHKKRGFVGKVSELYREDIVQRFSAFLSRIGLPD